MPILTQDNIADYDTPDNRVNLAVSNVERQAWEDIRRLLNLNRGNYIWLLGGKHLHAEILQHTYENPSEHAAQETQSVSSRWIIPETLLQNARQPMPDLPPSFVVKGKAFDCQHPVSMERDVDFRIDLQRLFAHGFSSEAQFQLYLKNNIADSQKLADAGIFPNISMRSIRDDAARDLARECTKKLQEIQGRMRQFRELPKAFSANGVSEANVRLALQLSKEIPEEALSDLGYNTADIEEKIMRMQKKISVFEAVESLGQMKFEDPKEDYSVMQTHLNQMRKDWADFNNTALGAAPNLSANASPEAQAIAGRYVQFSTNDAKRAACRELRDEIGAVESAAKQYEKIRAALERIRPDAEEESPTIKNFVNAGVIDITRLKRDHDPKRLSEDITKELGMDAKDELVKSLGQLKQTKKDAEEGKKAKTGREAVLAVYQQYFEKKQGMPPDQARKAAQELYGRNAVGYQEVQLTDKMIDESRAVLADEQRGFFGRFGGEAHDLFVGSQQDFLCNIAESPVIGLYDRHTRWLNMPWLMRKGSGRPPWGRAEYPQLITAYFAIRDAARQHLLPNSSYVRRQLREVSHLLVATYMKNLARDFDASPGNEGKKAELEQSMDETARMRSQIRLFLSGDTPSFYGGDVATAIEYAKNITAKKRRAVGRGMRSTVTWPVKKTWALGAWGVKKIKGVFGGLTGFMNQRRKFF